MCSKTSTVFELLIVLIQFVIILTFDPKMDDCLDRENIDIYEVQASVLKCMPHKINDEEDKKWIKENCDTVKQTGYPKCFSTTYIKSYDKCVKEVGIRGKSFFQTLKESFQSRCGQPPATS